MKRSKFSEEQIVYAIRHADAGAPVGDLCRRSGERRDFLRLEEEIRVPGGE